jgi:hypothetical protein
MPTTPPTVPSLPSPDTVNYLLIAFALPVIALITEVVKKAFDFAIVFFKRAAEKSPGNGEKKGGDNALEARIIAFGDNIRRNSDGIEDVRREIAAVRGEVSNISNQIVQVALKMVDTK